MSDDPSRPPDVVYKDPLELQIDVKFPVPLKGVPWRDPIVLAHVGKDPDSR